MANTTHGRGRSRYVLYKQGSRRLIAWLLDTGARVGHKLARADTLPTKDLLQLARAISTANIVAPDDIQSTISDVSFRRHQPSFVSFRERLPSHRTSRRSAAIEFIFRMIASLEINVRFQVIYLRQQSATWYAQLARKDPQYNDGRIGAINNTHRFFIDALKTVRSLLKPVVNATEHKPRESKFANLFDNLDLEEPVESPTGLSPGLTERSGPAHAFTVDQDDDRAFGIWCVLEDFRDIRLYVHQLWRRYHDGEITFAMAAELTNLAFIMTNDIMNEVEDKQTQNYAFIARFLGLRNQQTDDGIYKFFSTNGSGADGMEASDTFCTPGWVMIHDFWRITRSIQQPSNKLNERNFFRGHPLAVALRNLAPQIQQLSAMMDSDGRIADFPMDEFTRSLLFVAK